MLYDCGCHASPLPSVMHVTSHVQNFYFSRPYCQPVQHLLSYIFFALLSLQISGCYSIFQFSCFRKSLENVNCLFLTIISLHEFVSFKMSSLLSSFVQSVLSIILLNHITVASQAISRLYVDHPFFTLHVTASLPFTLPSKFSWWTQPFLNFFPSSIQLGV